MNILKRIARWYQVEALTAVHTYFANGGKGNPLVIMPTGTGKAFCIADLIKDAMARWPTQRFIMAVHVTKLVEQNAETLCDHWPGAPVGLYAAELNARDHMQPIIFGSIASMFRCPEIFGFRDLLIIDEAHMVSLQEDTMFQQFIAGLKKVNPKLKVIGYTATWFRMGHGLLTDWGGTPDKPIEPIFTDICYNIADFANFNRLIDDGFLSMLVPRPMKTEIDLTGVSTQGDDYNQKKLEAATNKDKITIAALEEVLEHARDRHCWLCFAAGIDHAERVAHFMREMGINAATIHSRNSKELNKANMKGFKNGTIKCIVNYGKLTTGFDWAPIDLIIMLRATKSVVLWIQMLGRGTRIYDWWNEQLYKKFFNYTKHNCLVLDFARNTAKLGPINDPVIPKGKGKGGGEAPVKICEGCGCYNHVSARFCIGCGNEFPIIEKLVKEAGEEVLVKREEHLSYVAPRTEVLEVDNIFYSEHFGRGKTIPTMRVEYQCGYRTFSEYIGFESADKRGVAMAKQWWNKRTPVLPPATCKDAVEKHHLLKEPSHITVEIGAEYPRIIGVEFNGNINRPQPIDIKLSDILGDGIRAYN